jgi:hypothetical protein
VKSLLVRLALVFCGLALASCGRPGLGDLTVYTMTSPELALADTHPTSGVWSSAPWAADGVTWIPFRPHEQVQVEHDLPYTPSVVLTYIAFTASGETPSLSAGDLTRVVDVSGTTVTVWNDTNGSYFVRIVAY